MTSQVRNLWCRSQNKMGPSSKYVSSQHIVDLRQPQVAMKHHLRSVKNTCVAQSLYSGFRSPVTQRVSWYFLRITVFQKASSLGIVETGSTSFSTFVENLLNTMIFSSGSSQMGRLPVVGCRGVFERTSKTLL